MSFSKKRRKVPEVIRRYSCHERPLSTLERHLSATSEQHQTATAMHRSIRQGLGVGFAVFVGYILQEPLEGGLHGTNFSQMLS